MECRGNIISINANTHLVLTLKNVIPHAKSVQDLRTPAAYPVKTDSIKTKIFAQVIKNTLIT